MKNLNIVLLLAVFAFASCTTPIKEQKPNIIFIMSDDHTSQAIGAYGSRLAKLNPTPTIDKLAEEGMLFTNAFCNNSICSPSRASILTGQYSQTNGVLDLDDFLDVNKQYLPKELRKLGYSTAIVGKWHLHNEPANFDYYKVLPVQGKYFNPTFREKGKGDWPNNIVKSKGHSSDVITDLTLEYLKNRDQSKPFFLMHHYKAPHDMFEYAPRYADYLQDVEIPEPASLYYQPNWGSLATRGEGGSLEDVIGTSVSDRHRRRNYVKDFLEDSVSGDLSAHLAYQEYLKRYLRCVKGVDDNLGRLFSYLKEEGLWENTIIIYTGDQGMMLGEHDLQDKRWMYDESMRMPFIVYNPTSKLKNVKSDLLINNTDYGPTMIELAGGNTPEYMQGRSFVNTLRGNKETNWRTATYYRYWMHLIHHNVPAHFGIRTKEYKLIFYYNELHTPDSIGKNRYWWNEYSAVSEDIPVAWEFYDLKSDPEELHNRYNDPAFESIIIELKLELKRQREEYNETDKKYPAIQKVVNDNWEL